MSILSGILIRKVVGAANNEPRKFVKSIVPAVLLPIAGLILVLLALMFSIQPETLEKLLEGAETPYAVIEACDKWYGIITAATAAGLAIVVVCCVAAVIAGRKSAAAVLCAIFFSAFGFLVCGVMYLSEDVSELRTRAREDMAQITEGRPESAVVCFGKGVEREGLPGPYTEGQPTVFSVYSGIGKESGSRWRGYRILGSLGFAPDGGRLYNENKSVDWNDENAAWYSVTYTSNLHVVISVEPLN